MNLKEPPAPTPRNINKELEQDPTQDLEESVTNTKRIMDQATAAFHEEDNNANQTCLVIEGLSTIAPTAATNNQMLLLIQFIDKLGDKYRRILKEHKENETYHKEKFKESLSNLTKLYKHQARINMEHIITTQLSTRNKRCNNSSTNWFDHTSIPPQRRSLNNSMTNWMVIRTISTANT
jgi:predicted ABC-class ATPase